MKISSALLSISAFAVCATVAAAFSMGPAQTRLTAHSGPTSRSHQTGAAKSLRMSSEDFAKSEIASNDIVVFSKTYCPYCTSTKELFKGLGVNFKVHELDKMGSEGSDIQNALLKMTGQKSVPNVFVKQQHIGGNDKTQAAAKDGSLQKMLSL